MMPTILRTSQSAPPASLRASLASQLDDMLQTQAKPRARQIVSCRDGRAANNADSASGFLFHENTLRAILLRQDVMSKKVAVISMTGPSRTGKSFFLSLMLQRLSHPRPSRSHRVEDLNAGTNFVAEETWNSRDVNTASIDFAANNGENGFAWRAGCECDTIGVWMWDTPFICKSSSGEDIAVFLVDAQGLFDSETSGQLAESIFGFTTLLSSTQIYNVSKIVGEDTLQNLGRFAGCSSLVSETAGTSTASSSNSSEDGNDVVTPFQRAYVLVRDWQSFTRAQTIDEKRAVMSTVRDNVLAPRKDAAMKQTRQQLKACFQDVDFFMLPYPGSKVTDPEYDGSVDLTDDKFMELTTMFIDELIDPAKLIPKAVHGASVTCFQLFTYAKTYAGLFQDASRFPDAAAVFAASTAANIEDVKAKALEKYAKEMLKFCEPDGLTFVRGKTFLAHHEECKDKSLGVFDEARTVGELSRATRGEIIEHIDNEFPVYKKLIKHRNYTSAGKVVLVTLGVALNVPFADALL